MGGSGTRWSVRQKAAGGGPVSDDPIDAYVLRAAQIQVLVLEAQLACEMEKIRKSKAEADASEVALESLRVSLAQLKKGWA